MALDRSVYVPPGEGFFATDAFTDYAVQFIAQCATNPAPFFLYLAYTAPHWPLQARPETIAKYRGQYKAIGWDELREQRYERLKKSGMIDARWPLAPRPANVRPWERATPERQDQWDLEMAIYGAQIEEMDNGIGRVMDALRKAGRDSNTLVMFMSDNGGAAEDPNRSLPGAVLGTRESFRGYGIGGAQVSSSPFRKTKKFTHEGGIAVPLIIRWPGATPQSGPGRLTHTVSHLIDIMPTCLEVARAEFPSRFKGAATLPPEGISLAPLFTPGQTLTRPKPLLWEHEGHKAVRNGKWKLVASFNEPWELYDMENDRVESRDLSASRSRVANELIAMYEDWARRVGVKSWPAPAPAPAKVDKAERTAPKDK
jgi:arylsulfatase